MSTLSLDERRALRTVVVILAGGVGVRAGLGMPKQLARIAGKTILEHTLEAVHAADVVDEVVVMMERGHLPEALALTEGGRFPKLSGIHPGGVTRNDTTRRAIELLTDAVGDAELKVLFHDAVRPFVSERILLECVAALDEFDAVDTAIPSADTIIEVTGENTIANVPPRSLLRRGQTPQGFLLSTIRRAYEQAALDDGFEATDDCTVVLRYTPSVPIVVVSGSDENMKVTEGIDVFIADKLFQLRRTAADVLDDSVRAERLEGKTVVVFGGSSGIGLAIAEHVERLGARAFSFSRSATGTHVENREQVVSALESVVRETGGIDYVVNAAGILDIGALEQASPAAVDQMVSVNLLGPVIVAQESLPHLKKSSGQLLFFTSSSYTRGRAGYAMYSATKAATVNLTQALAEEWQEHGVRVNCINPERTSTPMRSAAFGEEPPETLLSAEQVALASIDTLVSDVTGQVIDVRRHARKD